MWNVSPPFHPQQGPFQPKHTNIYIYVIYVVMAYTPQYNTYFAHRNQQLYRHDHHYLHTCRCLKTQCLFTNRWEHTQSNTTTEQNRHPTFLDTFQCPTLFGCASYPAIIRHHQWDDEHFFWGAGTFWGQRNYQLFVRGVWWNSRAKHIIGFRPLPTTNRPKSRKLRSGIGTDKRRNTNTILRSRRQRERERSSIIGIYKTQFRSCCALLIHPQ